MKDYAGKFQQSISIQGVLTILKMSSNCQKNSACKLTSCTSCDKNCKLLTSSTLSVNLSTCSAAAPRAVGPPSGPAPRLAALQDCPHERHMSRASELRPALTSCHTLSTMRLVSLASGSAHCWPCLATATGQNQGDTQRQHNSATTHAVKKSTPFSTIVSICKTCNSLLTCTVSILPIWFVEVLRPFLAKKDKQRCACLLVGGI